MGLVAGKELQLIGSHGFDGANDFPKLLNMVSTRQLDPSILITKQVSLHEGCTILENMEYTSPIGIIIITKFNGTDTYNEKEEVLVDDKDKAIEFSISSSVKHVQSRL